MGTWNGSASKHVQQRAPPSPRWYSEWTFTGALCAACGAPHHVDLHQYLEPLVKLLKDSFQKTKCGSSYSSLIFKSKAPIVSLWWCLAPCCAGTCNARRKNREKSWRPSKTVSLSIVSLKLYTLNCLLIFPAGLNVILTHKQEGFDSTMWTNGRRRYRTGMINGGFIITGRYCKYRRRGIKKRNTLSDCLFNTLAPASNCKFACLIYMVVRTLYEEPG